MRARERYVHVGPAQFGDAELVGLLLGTGSAQRSALEMGAGLLARFGGLPGLAMAEPRALMEERGVGLARAVRLHAALQAGRRSLRCDEGAPLAVLGPEDAARHLVPGLRGLQVEQLHALYLDRMHRPVALRMLAQGSDRACVVDSRQVFRPAVSIGASAVVLAHNHPSGDPTPSAQDLEVTRRVDRAGRVLGVRLLDHLVVGASSHVSLAERGALQAWNSQAPGVLCVSV